MALNPPMTPSGEPTRVNGEYFVLSRSGMEFEIKIDNYAKFKGKGTVSTILQFPSHKLNI
jgi:hypothetical protein